MESAVRYLPADAAQVVVARTDLDGDQWRALDERLAQGELANGPTDDGGDRTDPPPPRSLKGVLEQALATGDPSGEPISFAEDLDPVLGGKLVIGAGRAGISLQEPGSLVAALDTGDGEAARSLLEKLDIPEQGEAHGATIYGDGPAPFMALDGDVLVFAIDEGRGGEGVEEALARARDEDHLRAEQLDEALAGLPDEALLSVYLNPESILSSPETEPLLGLPWFAALESLGAAASFEDGALLLEATARTDEDQLTEADLPLPTGLPTPELVRREGEIAGASANQSRTTVFLLRAVRAAFPDASFVRDVAKLERALDIDFERQFLRQFDGPSASSLPLTEAFSARSEVKDPRRMAEVLRKLAPDIGRLIQDLQGLQGRGLIPLFLLAPDAPIAPGVLGESRIVVETIPGERNLYRISNLIPPRLRPVTPLPRQVIFGLLDGVFVVASDIERAREIAEAPSEQPPEGLSGASIVTGDLGPLRGNVHDILGLDPGPLGELTGSLRATTSEVRASARIELP